VADWDHGGKVIYEPCKARMRSFLPDCGLSDGISVRRNERRKERTIW
jgi:hypothetical protein